jgi:hypothetical protein
MSNKKTRKRAAADKREGKSASTQAGEFVREEIHHVREGKHGGRSAKQVIAIGLSKARRDGVALPPPPRRQATVVVRKQAARDNGVARKHHKPSRARSRASLRALEHEGSAAASPVALSKHAHAVSRSKAATSPTRREAQGGGVMSASPASTPRRKSAARWTQIRKLPRRLNDGRHDDRRDSRSELTARLGAHRAPCRRRYPDQRQRNLLDRRTQRLRMRSPQVQARLQLLSVSCTHPEQASGRREHVTTFAWLAIDPVNNLP